MPNKKQDKKRSYGQLPEGKSGREYSRTKSSFDGLNKISVINSDNIVECSNIVFDEYPYIVPRKNFKNLTELTLYGGIHADDNSIGVYKNLIKGDNTINANQEWYAASALQDFIIFLCNPSQADRMGIITFAVKSNEVGQNLVEIGFITSSDYKVQHIERGDFDTTELLSQYTDKNYAYYPEVRLKVADGASGASYNAARIGIEYSNLQSGASDYSLSGYYKSNSTKNTIRNFRHIAKNNNRFYVSNCTFYNVSGFTGSDESKLYENSVAVSDKNYGADIGTASFTFSDESADAWGTVSDDETEFVGLFPYNETVLGFKRHYIYIISRLKNPFLITQAAKKGCVSFNTVCEINGLIYFLSDDGVNVFNGSSCSVISGKLDMPALWDEEIAHCAGTDGRRYFLFTTYRNGDRHFYVYDTSMGLWSEWDYSLSEKISSTTSDNVVTDTWYPLIRYVFNVKDRTFLIADRCMNVYEVDTYDRGKIESDKYSELEWSITFDITNKLATNVSGICTKRIKQIRLFADMADDAEISVYARLDNSTDEYGEPYFKLLKTYEKPYTVSSGGEKKSVRPGITRERILVTPLKTANISYQIRIGGKGYVKLYDVEVVTDYGGNAYQPKKE